MWSTPRTWATGDTVSSSLLNVHIRDNLNYLYDPPSCRAHHDSNQSASPGPGQVVDFNRTDYDTDNMRNITESVSPFQPSMFIAARTAGYYLITSDLAFSIGKNGGIRIGIIRETESEDAIVVVDNTNPGTTSPCKINMQTVYPLTTTGGLVVIAQISGEESLDLLAAVPAEPSVSVHWLGAS